MTRVKHLHAGKVRDLYSDRGDLLLVASDRVSATDVPAGSAGPAIRGGPLTMIKVECVARGYLTGSALQEYRRSSTVCGVPRPSGLVEGSKLPGPIFTPTTKADTGHDLPMTFDD